MPIVALTICSYVLMGVAAASGAWSLAAAFSGPSRPRPAQAIVRPRIAIRRVAAASSRASRLLTLALLLHALSGPVVGSFAVSRAEPMLAPEIAFDLRAQREINARELAEDPAPAQHVIRQPQPALLEHAAHR